MKTPRRKLPRSDKPMPLRVPPALMARIKIASEKLGLSIADVIRTSVGVGLERLRRINYNIDGAINDAAENALPDTLISMVAESPDSNETEIPKVLWKNVELARTKKDFRMSANQRWRTTVSTDRFSAFVKMNSLIEVDASVAPDLGRLSIGRLKTNGVVIGPAGAAKDYSWVWAFQIVREF